MTERSLYALLWAAICSFVLSYPVAPAAAQQTQPPCALCVAAAILPAQTLLLPDDLHGLTVLVRDDGVALDALKAAADAVSSRGGRPGVLVATPSGRNPQERRYRLKLRLTDLRADLGPGVLLLLTSPADPEFAGYADAFVGARPVDGRIRVWPLLERSDLETALDVTRRGGAEQWVLPVPLDVLDARRTLDGLVRAAAPPGDVLTEAVQVRGLRRLTAEEIVARHQASARRQAALMSRAISTGDLTLTFEAPGFPAPITISSTTITYASPERTELEQRAIRVNGIEFRDGSVPHLPLLEPERAASPPMAISLTSVYRYRLAGEDVLDGVRCYVVDFAPLAGGRSLFEGRAWIAMDDFGMARVAARQTGLRGAIVSSEQVDDFRRERAGVWLLARSDVRQIYEGAAHRTPIHRVLTIDAYEIDPPDFDARLTAAYASPSVMLRDTPEGYRYLKREPVEDAAALSKVVVEVAERATRVRTLAAGVIIDPNISVPLPFAGLSYVDFDLWRTGTQLNAFFGGSYAQAAFSVPSLAGSRWQLAGRAFGIASSYNDRSFRGGREIYGENLRQRPAHASAWLLRPLSPRLTLRAGYEFDYTRLAAAPETAASFVVPADQVVHGLRVALEGQRAGWAGSIWWNPARRAGWRRWGGRDDDYSPSDESFQRFGAVVSRTGRIRPAVSGRVEGAVMAGQDLDRFSQYSFGTFDNRLHGYPSALVRYDRGGVVRGSLSWTLSRFARLDGFLDSAFVRDRGFGRVYRNYTGVGAAVEGPAPFGLLGAVEWGYGFRGVDAEGAQGTHVIRLSAYKMF